MQLYTIYEGIYVLSFRTCKEQNYAICLLVQKGLTGNPIHCIEYYENNFFDRSRQSFLHRLKRKWWLTTNG